MPATTLLRPRSITLAVALLWLLLYGSFTLFTPPLLDDADSVHAEVAREMLLRHDDRTLYANGIRYLEKAPLLYWSMAAAMRVAQALGHPGALALTVAARVPLALSLLALSLLMESFGRRVFASARVGLYTALMTLASPGLFLYTRLTLPDGMLCLWLAVALYAFYRTEATVPPGEAANLRRLCFVFAAACALGVLTKGLIGLVFPAAIVAAHLLLTRGPRGMLQRLRALHPCSSAAVFLGIAVPWHLLAALANPTQGHPGSLAFHHGHWQVPLPTDGNVHGWLWFYFVNEQLLRYLNLRVPRDYDTVPLGLFWGLILVWLFPFSAFLFSAVGRAAPVHLRAWRRRLLTRTLRPTERSLLFLVVWAAIPLLFFSLSTRQEYYVLPALPPLILLIAHLLALRPARLHQSVRQMRGISRAAGALALVGGGAAAACVFLALNSGVSAGTADLASLLQQHPADYALSMGHFLDLNARAFGLFRLPLALAAIALGIGLPAAWLVRRPWLLPAIAATRSSIADGLTLASAVVFLCAAHLGLRTFAPVLSSQRLAAAIAPLLRPDDLIVIHQEYEYGSTLGFYLQRPGYAFPASLSQTPQAIGAIHILQGRSSNLWYGSFFPDAPAIFETPQSLAAQWSGPRRIFLWQDLGDQPGPLPPLPGPIYRIVADGGKEIVSNQPNR